MTHLLASIKIMPINHEIIQHDQNNKYSGDICMLGLELFTLYLISLHYQETMSDTKKGVKPYEICRIINTIKEIIEKKFI